LPEKPASASIGASQASPWQLIYRLVIRGAT
jgi:hypothetical protein